jgi:hypothetical protein
MNFDQILVERNRREQAIRDSVTMTSMSRHNYVLKANGRVLPRTTVQRVTNLEQQTTEVKDSMAEFTKTVEARLNDANPKIGPSLRTKTTRTGLQNSTQWPLTKLYLKKKVPTTISALTPTITWRSHCHAMPTDHPWSVE